MFKTTPAPASASKKSICFFISDCKIYCILLSIVSFTGFLEDLSAVSNCLSIPAKPSPSLLTFPNI